MSKVHLALAPFAKLRGPYFDFFRQRAEEGELVILDNGSYEGVSMHDQLLIELALAMKPAIIVAPDQLSDFVTTEKMYNRFRERCSRRFAGSRSPMILKMLQAPDGAVNSWIAAYEIACMQVNHIGLPRLMSRTFGPHARAEFIKRLKREGLWMGHGRYHHCFGMIDGNLDELEELRDLEVDSIDSSAPINRGIHGYRLGTKWPGYQFDPCPPLDCNWECARENVKEVLTRCK